MAKLSILVLIFIGSFQTFAQSTGAIVNIHATGANAQECLKNLKIQENDAIEEAISRCSRGTDSSCILSDKKITEDTQQNQCSMEISASPANY